MQLARDGYQENPGSLDGSIFHAWKHTTDLFVYSSGRQVIPDPKRIAGDIDGCYYDFNGIMAEWLVARGWDPKKLVSPTTYSLAQAWGLPRPELKDEMQRALAAGVMFRRGSAYPEATESIRHLGLSGHRIVMNSARLMPGMELEARRATMQWLRENGIHPDETHLVHMDGGDHKLAVPFDLLIDDAPDNVRAALAAGRSAVLLDRPWNVDAVDLPRASYIEIRNDLSRFIK